MYNDSKITLHKICRILENYMYKWLWVSSSARETVENSFPSPEKFSVCTDMIVSIEWQNLVPRLRICDCFEILHLHCDLCDLLLSRHRNCRPEVLHRQCASCQEPLQSWCSCRFRNFCLLGSEYNDCTSSIPLW